MKMRTKTIKTENEKKNEKLQKKTKKMKMKLRVTVESSNSRIDDYYQTKLYFFIFFAYSFQFTNGTGNPFNNLCFYLRVLSLKVCFIDHPCSPTFQKYLFVLFNDIFLPLDTFE